MDFRSPSIKQTADFLLHLFQEKNLQPSIIDRYRSAIADKLCNASLNISKDENLNRLLESFHRDRPKGRHGVPTWNLSLVLYQLTMVIPALARTLDKSLKEDRSLCPMRALRYYLDKTQALRQGKELVFVSFKKGFNKDISPATISSWIKQTIILYELSDQEALTLHQVRAQGGISLDQILTASHWKSHNTFTQFYLKDVAWADSELFHLGPVVAAQQIHH